MKMRNRFIIGEEVSSAIHMRGGQSLLIIFIRTYDYVKKIRRYP